MRAVLLLLAVVFVLSARHADAGCIGGEDAVAATIPVAAIERREESPVTFKGETFTLQGTVECPLQQDCVLRIGAQPPVSFRALSPPEAEFYVQKAHPLTLAACAKLARSPSQQFQWTITSVSFDRKAFNQKAYGSTKLFAPKPPTYAPQIAIARARSPPPVPKRLTEAEKRKYGIGMQPPSSSATSTSAVMGLAAPPRYSEDQMREEVPAEVLSSPPPARVQLLLKDGTNAPLSAPPTLDGASAQPKKKIGWATLRGLLARNKARAEQGPEANEEEEKVEKKKDKKKDKEKEKAEKVKADRPKKKEKKAKKGAAAAAAVVVREPLPDLSGQATSDAFLLAYAAQGGRSLVELLQKQRDSTTARSADKLPYMVTYMLGKIYGPDNAPVFPEGFFRISASQAVLERFRDLLSRMDVAGAENAVEGDVMFFWSAALKNFLRLWMKPVFNYDQTLQFLDDGFDLSAGSPRQRLLDAAWLEQPASVVDLLDALFTLARRVTEQPAARMGYENLSTMFGPCLFETSPDLMQSMEEATRVNAKLFKMMPLWFA